MYDDERREAEEDKSLLKDIAKKGISKKLKAMPLKTKLIIAAVIAGIVFFLLIVVVLISGISMLFFFNDDKKDNYEMNYGYVLSENKVNYWWPIGGSNVEVIDGKRMAPSNPTATTISSEYGYRTLIKNGKEESDFHGGIDIAPSGTTDYVIAAADGEIYMVGTGCSNNEGIDSTCNYGMGNYVTIKHPDGNFTRYAHLQPNSITVSKGQNVKQGQIIGEMGNSGSSIGKHLDFKVFVGSINTNPSNPLEFISTEKTRPEQYTKSKLLSMLQSWEGTGPTEGDNYKVYDDGYGNLTVGHGVTIEWQGKRFKKHGIDPSTLKEGSLVSKEIVDAVELEIVTEKRSSAVNTLKKNNVELTDYQIDALAIRIYNVGNMKGFIKAYNEYGNTQDLYDEYMKNPVTASNGEYSLGLERRREAEWKLFHEGIYTIK